MVALGVVGSVLGVGDVAASPTPRAGAEDRAVVSGDARFEVLSPTLIRTEYAGDARFVDAATFNAIGRDSFESTPFTSHTEHGWLTIRTSVLTLKYRVGSGKFSGDNLTVTERAAKQDVTAHPWPAPARCAPGKGCEAEDLDLSGVDTATDHKGYTGRGFAAGFINTGTALSFALDVPKAGTYAFSARYTNGTAGDGTHTARTLTLAVDGGAGTTLKLPETDDWDDWAVATAALDLPAGEHTITLTHTAGDSGNVNLDSLAVHEPGAEYPTPTREVLNCDFAAVCEAETGTLSGPASVKSHHNGFSGRGFATTLDSTAARDTLHTVGVPEAGTYDVQLRYANSTSPADPNAKPVTRRVSVTAGSATTTARLEPTADWDSWRTVAVPVKLAAGANDITLGCPDEAGCKVDLDTVAVTAHGAPLLASHAPLGGYRRGLDGVNGADGNPRTVPGLLYQDGWSLLDDTASALYDQKTGKITQRPEHDDHAYQDGYVFGYGHDYQRALADLAALTGPDARLPRWTYGVWFSEYLDRTAADYRALLEKMRSEGMPLDSLVVDTDYKSPDAWNGWEFDTTKFPDPDGFLKDVAAQGVHNSLNIHPSIMGSDPQFAQAQRTAKGKLKKGSCAPGGDCYTFDFGDPDQLKAYMELHDTMERQGGEVWWFDWCCDDSRSTLKGVTPDAWISAQYAARGGDKGPGFAFSRAYGSLQDGGYGSPTAVPTGPWADKRTTLHFTGDTMSSWGTLRQQVGYTPGESVATGLSAISHDIGGHNDTTGLQGSDTYQQDGQTRYTSKLPDDLYARWVQFGTFQPIDRLHSNHGDRLPWQYGKTAQASAKKFLDLREKLIPYTYTLADQAHRTGTPMLRPTYLEYPDQQEAYATAGSEYLYGSDVLVAPVTRPGETATTSVWFPPGTWTDYFTGKTYKGGASHEVTTGLDTMPVFVKAGGIVPTRSDDVAHDSGNPLTDVTLTVAQGAPGTFSLHEDDGTPANGGGSATTRMRATQKSGETTLRIAPTLGHFTGQATQRTWTVDFTNGERPRAVCVDGRRAAADTWTYDATSRTVTVHVPRTSIRRAVTVTSGCRRP
ncbi:TIM-barrel domain-containing protein [Streptomyces sp. UC4497]